MPPSKRISPTEDGRRTNNATPASPVDLGRSRDVHRRCAEWRSHAAVVLQMPSVPFFRTRVRQAREVAILADTLAHAVSWWTR